MTREKKKQELTEHNRNKRNRVVRLCDNERISRHIIKKDTV